MKCKEFVKIISPNREDRLRIKMKTNKGELITIKNIALTFDLIRYLVDHPDILEQIPDGAHVEFLDMDLPIEPLRHNEHDNNEAVLFQVEHSFKTLHR
jgi:hypothetical protein